MVSHVSAPLRMYLGAVLSHGVVVEAGLGPELFVALLALQGILELQGVKGQREDQITFLLTSNPTIAGCALYWLHQ